MFRVFLRHLQKKGLCKHPASSFNALAMPLAEMPGLRILLPLVGCSYLFWAVHWALIFHLFYYHSYLLHPHERDCNLRYRTSQPLIPKMGTCNQRLDDGTWGNYLSLLKTIVTLCLSILGHCCGRTYCLRELQPIEQTSSTLKLEKGKGGGRLEFDFLLDLLNGP